MRLSDFISRSQVTLNLRVRDKSNLIQKLAVLSAVEGGTPSAEVIVSSLQNRERLGSTGLGNGFALPHARVNGLNALRGQFVRLFKPIDFNAIDGKPVDLVFLVLTPTAQDTIHLPVLAAIARHLRRSEVRDRLRSAITPEQAWMVLCEADSP